VLYVLAYGASMGVLDSTIIWPIIVLVQKATGIPALEIL
jgi:hypothetical protein